MSKADRLGQLRRALREMLILKNQGSTFPKLSRAQGFVDGYMNALLEEKIATQRELLALVAEVRAEVDGPGTGEWSTDRAVPVRKAEATTMETDSDERFAFVRATA